jgi:alpha-tubulin suppressor-like RCC1 family protein
MADRFPGGVISKTPPTITAPVDGEGGSASGVWTLDEVLGYQKAGAWPKGVLPRELYAWGRNNAGQLGLNDTVNRSSPVQVGVLTTWSEIASGYGHNASVKTDGTLWTWGQNSTNGRLGDNTVINKSSPIQIGALTNWYQVACSRDNTASVKTDGTLWTWGSGTKGQLGDNTTFLSYAGRSSPVQVGALSDWSQVSCGRYFTAAVTTSGELYAWGNNLRGQIGNNSSGALQNFSSPVQVGALTTWDQVACGYAHTLAIKNDGTLWAWGYNGYGQVGDNTTVNKSSPVQVGALTNWSKVSGASDHTLAVKSDGTLWVFGRNANGELGLNDTVARSSPVQIGLLTTWSQVSTIATHNAALKTDGTLWTWGLNASGQIGDGTVIRRSSPVQVGALTNWHKVAAGVNHTAAITKG